MNRDDMKSAGLMGLIDAANKFQPERKFSLRHLLNIVSVARFRRNAKARLVSRSLRRNRPTLTDA